MFCTGWLLACRSRIVYERRPDNQEFYVLPVESILGKLPVVPVGDLSYQLATQDRFHTACVSTRRILSALHSIQEWGQVTEWWWYINTWALSWSSEHGGKCRSLVPCPAYFKTII
jgi:hypothetical protein